MRGGRFCLIAVETHSGSSALGVGTGGSRDGLKGARMSPLQRTGLADGQHIRSGHRPDATANWLGRRGAGPSPPTADQSGSRAAARCPHCEPVCLNRTAQCRSGGLLGQARPIFASYSWVPGFLLQFSSAPAAAHPHPSPPCAASDSPGHPCATKARTRANVVGSSGRGCAATSR